MKHVFEFTDVVKQFRSRVVLDRFSLTAKPGEVVALLGENGAGKTTALRILLGFERATSGSTSVFGMRSEQRSSEIRRRIGYVSDEPALYDYMNVAEIGWFCSGFYEPGFVKRYQDQLKAFSVPLDQRIKALSRGQRAKVSLALAMAHEPELLVLDEPTSGLDPVVRRQFLESMVDVAASGRTVLLASHQVAEVERVADRVAIVRDGRLEVCESVEDLKNEVRELKVTWANGSKQLPSMPALNLLSRRDSQRQSSLLIRGFDDSITGLLTAAPEVASIDVHRPSLEEIYVACVSGQSGDNA